MPKKSFFLFSLLVTLGTSAVCAAAVEPAQSADVQTYENLIQAIRVARAASEKRVERAVRREKVREAWEIGKLIDKHVLLHKERAEYGEQVLKRLAQDLGINERELRFMLEFSRAYPILKPASQLSWSHYQALLGLSDENERAEVEKLAEAENWTRDQVRAEVTRRNARKKSAQDSGAASERKVLIPPVQAGEPDVYRVVKGDGPGVLVIDLGFSNYLSFETANLIAENRAPVPFKEGDLFQVVFWERNSMNEKSTRHVYRPAPGKEPYTYRGQIFDVIDGDTVKAIVNLGFGFKTVQTLRLRAIDAPERESSEGKEAKAYLENLLRKEAGPRMNHLPQPSAERPEPFAPVLIKTSRSDKYDRYLADLFLDGVNLNQALVDAGHAEPLET